MVAMKVKKEDFNPRVTYLHALNFEFHVVLPGCFAIFSLLPAVAITSVADLLSRVEQHRATLGSEKA